MVNQRLVDWIGNLESKGYRENQLKSILLKKGYQDKDIEEAFNFIKNKDIVTSESFDFWDKIKYLFSNPNLFFENIKAEKGIRNSFLNFSIVAIGVTIISFGMSFMLTYIQAGSMGLVVFGLFSPFFLTIGLGVTLLSSFVYSGLVHVVVIAFKGQGDYAETYKSYAYSMIPSMILVLIPLIGLLSIIYSFILMIIGVSKLHNISKGKAALACLMPVILIIGIVILLVSFFFFRLSI